MKRWRLKCPAPLRDTPMADHAFWGIEIDGKEYTAILGREPVDEAGLDERWHLSIAGVFDVIEGIDVPPWNVIAKVAHELRPGVPFAIGVPPRSWWMNVHEGTLHLWELKDENLLGQWRFERRGDTPT